MTHRVGRRGASREAAPADAPGPEPRLPTRCAEATFAAARPSIARQAAQFYAEQDELEIGHALHCALDYGEAEAFPPDISLQRTKTLMQGDAFCDHRYVRARPVCGRG